MSQAAAYVDPAMVVVKNLGYDSWQTIYFQRATVILTELVLVYALSRYGTRSFFGDVMQWNSDNYSIDSLSPFLFRTSRLRM